jgi:hypothetical protein
LLRGKAGGHVEGVERIARVAAGVGGDGGEGVFVGGDSQDAEAALGIAERAMEEGDDVGFGEGL